MFTSKLFGGLALAFALTTAVQTIRVNHFEDSRDEWREAHAAQKYAYLAAQDAALASAIAAQTKTRNQYEDLAKSVRHSPRSGAFRDDAARWVRTQASKGSARSPAGSSEGGPAPVDHGPGTSSEFLWISRKDFDILAGNTERLIEVNDWGEKLIAADLAIPEVALSAEK